MNTFDSRIRVRTKTKGRTGRYIIYWMQQAQRAEYNPALDYAIELANLTTLPLVVLFVFASVAEANQRHYRFMAQGLHETAQHLFAKGMEVYYLIGDPPKVISELAKDALEVVADMGYLRYQRFWREQLQQKLSYFQTGYTEIETEALIPVTLTSDKEEYAAATLRRKITRQMHNLILPEGELFYNPKKPSGITLPIHHCQPQHLTIKELSEWIDSGLHIDASVSEVSNFRGGRSYALEHLGSFMLDKIKLYATKRNEPSLNIQSGLSPYLHFGQISVMEIIQHLSQAAGIDLAKLGYMIEKKDIYTDEMQNYAAFAEELIIRRELSFNFCYYNQDYDSFGCLPNWAKQTLLNHLHDKRETHYSLDRLEQCTTDDIYWNSAQKEMMEKGKMHNYMRMYWGKRLISWFDSPEEAYQVLLYLNNKYELDGRDPNAYAGVAWCFGKHDRPWQKRPIYGSVRYMNATGLNRKFDMNAYLKKQGM